jgi:hypothetical protein
MTDIVRRVADRAHIGPGGPGWNTNEAAFSNPTGRLNLITNPTMAFKVESDAPSSRNKITLLPNGFILIDTTAAINALVPATTALFTVPTGFSFQCKAFFARCTAAVGINNPAHAGVGIGSGDEVFQDQDMIGLISAGLTYRFPTGGNSQIVLAGQSLGFTISDGASGTSQTLEVQAYGRLFE